MKIDQITPEALKLAPRERALLAASLWESIEDPNEITDSWSNEDALEVAVLRDAEIESGEVVPLTHRELMNIL